MRVFFDSNVFGYLDASREDRERVIKAIGDRRIEVIVTPKVVEELAEGPLGGVPSWLPVRFEGEGVLLAGGRVGDHFSDGRLLLEHLGRSRKITDAILAESAQYADICVSNDRRFLRRLTRFSTAVVPMRYRAFLEWL